MASHRYWTASLLLAVFSFYLYTLAPSLTWGDGARLQMEVILAASNYWFVPELSHLVPDTFPFAGIGIMPWDHPLYLLLGQLFLLLPFGDALFRINLMSAVTAALAVVLTYQVALFIARDRWAAAIGAIALSVSHTFWFHAVTAEVYSLHVVFMVSVIWIALRWPVHGRVRELQLFALLAGMGLANHLMMVLTLLPAVAYMIVTPVQGSKSRSFDGTGSDQAEAGQPLVAFCLRTMLGLVGLFLLGLAPWWIQFLRTVRSLGLPMAIEVATWFPGLPRMVLNQSWGTVIENFAAYGGHMLYQFMPIAFAIGLYGMVRVWKANVRIALFVSTLFFVHIVFSANYPVGDRFAFHQPSYVIFAVFVSCGVAGLTYRHRARGPAGRQVDLVWRGLLLLLILSPVPLYAAVPRTLRARGLTEQSLGIPAIGVGGRDGLRYFLNPNKRGEDSAARFGRTTLEQLAPRAIVLAPRPDREVSLVLRYYQTVEGLRADVHVDPFGFVSRDSVPQKVLATVRSQTPCRPVYLASLDPSSYPVSALRSEFVILPEANLYRVRPRRPPSAKTTCPPPFEAGATINLDRLIKDALR